MASSSDGTDGDVAAGQPVHGSPVHAAARVLPGAPNTLITARSQLLIYINMMWLLALAAFRWSLGGVVVQTHQCNGLPQPDTGISATTLVQQQLLRGHRRRYWFPPPRAHGPARRGTSSKRPTTIVMLLWVSIMLAFDHKHVTVKVHTNDIDHSQEIPIKYNHVLYTSKQFPSLIAWQQQQHVARSLAATDKEKDYYKTVFDTSQIKDVVQSPYRQLYMDKLDCYGSHIGIFCD